MPKTALKELILKAVDDLPPDATLEDAIERLIFLAKIEEGLAQADAGQLTPHEDVVRRFTQ